MTYEEAIKILDEFGGSCSIDLEYVAAHIAIEAIEKQIPKKPITLRFPFSLCCPICKSSVGFYSEQCEQKYFLPTIEIIKLKYCAACGQALDWSE